MERNQRRPPDVEEALSSMLWTPYERTPSDSSSDEDEKLNVKLKKSRTTGSFDYEAVLYDEIPTSANTIQYVPSIRKIRYDNFRFSYPYYGAIPAVVQKCIASELPSYESLYHNMTPALTSISGFSGRNGLVHSFTDNFLAHQSLNIQGTSGTILRFRSSESGFSNNFCDDQSGQTSLTQAERVEGATCIPQNDDHALAERQCFDTQASFHAAEASQTTLTETDNNKDPLLGSIKSVPIIRRFYPTIWTESTEEEPVDVVLKDEELPKKQCPTNQLITTTKNPHLQSEYYNDARHAKGRVSKLHHLGSVRSKQVVSRELAITTAEATSQNPSNALEATSTTKKTKRSRHSSFSSSEDEVYEEALYARIAHNDLVKIEGFSSARNVVVSARHGKVDRCSNIVVDFNDPPNTDDDDDDGGSFVRSESGYFENSRATNGRNTFPEMRLNVPAAATYVASADDGRSNKQTNTVTTTVFNSQSVNGVVNSNDREGGSNANFGHPPNVVIERSRSVAVNDVVQQAQLQSSLMIQVNQNNENCENQCSSGSSIWYDQPKNVVNQSTNARISVVNCFSNSVVPSSSSNSSITKSVNNNCNEINASSNVCILSNSIVSSGNENSETHENANHSKSDVSNVSVYSDRNQPNGLTRSAEILARQTLGRTFISTESQTDNNYDVDQNDIDTICLSAVQNPPHRIITAADSLSGQATAALLSREQRRRERREQRRLARGRHPHIIVPAPPSMLRPMLPDILHSHFPPPYTALTLTTNPPPPPPSSLIAPVISTVPIATVANDGRFTFPLPVIRRSPSERSGKGCCGQWFAGPPLRALIAVVALGGVACALGGAALGATGLAGPPSSHLTAALLMIGVGVILVTVSGAAWRMTAPGGPPCLGLGSSVDLGRCGRRPCSSRGGAPHGLLYPEFQHRPPPPSYQASMQEYRLRLLLLDRDRQTGTVRGSSPPPTYRSHAGSLLRAPLSTPTRHGGGSNSIGGPGSECSLPPSYRSRSIILSSSNNNTNTLTSSIAGRIGSREEITSTAEDAIESTNNNQNLLPNENVVTNSSVGQLQLHSLTLNRMESSPFSSELYENEVPISRLSATTATTSMINRIGATVHSNPEFQCQNNLNFNSDSNSIINDGTTSSCLSPSKLGIPHPRSLRESSSIGMNTQLGGANIRKELVTIVTISGSDQCPVEKTHSEMEILAHL